MISRLPSLSRASFSRARHALLATIAAGTYLYLAPRLENGAGIWAASAAAAAAYGFALLDDGLRLNLLSHLARRVVIVLVPPLALIFLVLGTIFLGIATPTEGGAMGAAGALIIAMALAARTARRRG